MSLRQQLVEKRAEVRTIKQEMERIEALATINAVGKNAEERKANVTITPWRRSRLSGLLAEVPPHHDRDRGDRRCA